MPYIVRVFGKDTTYLTRENTLSPNIKDAEWYPTQSDAWQAIDGYIKLLQIVNVQIVKIPLEEKDANTEK